MALTRMIFAIQTTDPKPTRVRVSGDVGTPAPAMTRWRRGDSTPAPVSCLDGAWTMDLERGDYLVELQAATWVAGRLDIVVELTPGQSPPTFVYQGPPSQSPSAVGLVAWSATALYVDPPESSFVADPKDPWPPPPPPAVRVTLAQVSAAWFTAELAAARARIAVQSNSKSIPASILDALVTER
jgi:hypothetical protein